MPRRIVVPSRIIEDVGIKVTASLEPYGILTDEPSDTRVVISGTKVIQAPVRLKFSGCVAQEVRRPTCWARLIAEPIPAIRRLGSRVDHTAIAKMQTNNECFRIGER